MVLCVQVSTRHIICKLYFDVGGEEESLADPESLQVDVPLSWFTPTGFDGESVALFVLTVLSLSPSPRTSSDE